MKRYWLFAGDYYYPLGGMIDFRGGFDTIDEAKEKCETLGDDWFQIADVKTSTLIAEGSKDMRSDPLVWKTDLDSEVETERPGIYM